MSKPAVTIMGLGLMGSGMAGRLLDAGYPLTVYNRTAAKSAALEKAGARVAATPADAVEGAEVVISILADDNASRAVWLGAGGALDAVGEGAVLIESGTVTVGWIRELASAAAERGLPLLDAPVTGSRVQAAEGNLLFLVGGDEAVLERVRPVLAPMSRDVLHLGPSGSGTSLKLINNFLCGVQAASLAEAFAMVARSGLDLERAMAMLTAGAPGSPLVKSLTARMMAADFTPHFALHLLVKDMRYASTEGERLGVTLRMAEAAREVMEHAVAAGYGELDMSAVVQQFRQS